MTKVKISIIILVYFLVFSTSAFGEIIDIKNQNDIINDIKHKYGIDVVLVNSYENVKYNSSLNMLEEILNSYPDGLVKEVNDYYKSLNITSNIIINKTEKIKELKYQFNIDSKSINFYVNSFYQGPYSNTYIISEEGLNHTIGHIIADYILKIYPNEKIKQELENINQNFVYGNWNTDYEKVFVNKHAATSFKDELGDLIWYAQSYPKLLRNMSKEEPILQKKILYLVNLMDECFVSIDENTNLWSDSIYQTPDLWAKEIVDEYESKGLLLEEYDGLYTSYITKEDFAKVLLVSINSKFSSDNIIKANEKHYSIDPLNGETVFDKLDEDDILDDKENTFKINTVSSIIEKFINENSNKYISRLEIARLLSKVAKQLYLLPNENLKTSFNDLSHISDSDLNDIVYLSQLEIIKGNNNEFKPGDYCTFQEAYIFVLRFFNLL